MMINLKESTVYFSHVRLNDFYLGHETIFIVHKQIIKPSTRGRPDKDFILQMYQRPHQKHSNRFKNDFMISREKYFPDNS